MWSARVIVRVDLRRRERSCLVRRLARRPRGRGATAAQASAPKRPLALRAHLLERAHLLPDGHQRPVAAALPESREQRAQCRVHVLPVVSAPCSLSGQALSRPSSARGHSSARPRCSSRPCRRHAAARTRCRCRASAVAAGCRAAGRHRRYDEHYVGLSRITSFSEWAIAEVSDLTLAEANNVSAVAVVGQPSNWMLAAANTGTNATTLIGRTILTDTLPNANVTYGPVTVTNVSSTASSASIGCAIASNTLTPVVGTKRSGRTVLEQVSTRGQTAGARIPTPLERGQRSGLAAFELNGTSAAKRSYRSARRGQ